MTLPPSPPAPLPLRGRGEQTGGSSDAFSPFRTAQFLGFTPRRPFGFPNATSRHPSGSPNQAPASH
ncbi:hypothetical protein CBM2587_A40121 [Cupriavidus taiwanensis]|uniref:Uncharacterized protein n=1 Tax=Cupriavidus taiwanensis TaxID=164546 RepID=A0A375BUE1_9BURK|nr:hypothetical protein CBM2587_A40121 [Cupriavidus taiwanensis]